MPEPKLAADLAALAQIHAACFTTPAPWTAAALAGVLASPHAFLLCAPAAAKPAGFLIGTAVAGEAELLTLAVAPEARRSGLGRQLLADFLRMAQTRGAQAAFLEVSAENSAAIALYRAAGFAEVGRRKGYYATPEGTRIDALVLRRSLG